MQFATMDKLLIDIYNIRNIESIKIIDLLLPGPKSKQTLIPSILISYDGGKTLNLDYTQKYFNTYVKKIVQVYNDEKNNILEDSLRNPFSPQITIKIDEHSKKILESGVLENVNEIYRFYEDKSPYQHSLLFNIDEVNLLLPILKYHLKELFSNTDKELSFDDEFTGYKDRYIINGKLDGIPTTFPIIYTKINENEHSFIIGGLIKNVSSVNMNIKFQKDSIIVKYSIPKYNMNGKSTYLISNGVVKSISEITKDNIPVYYVNKDLEESQNKLLNLTNFDGDTNLKWFRLPWNAYYGISSEIIELSEIEKTVEISNMYLYSSEDSFMRKEYYSKTYKKNNSSTMVLDESTKNTIGICISNTEKIYLIETSFLDTRDPNGYYEEKLKEKYFYHVVKSTSNIKNIDRNNLVPISKNDDILDNGDILKSHSVLKHVRGK